MKIYIYIMVLFTAAYLPLRHGVGAALRRQLGPVPFFCMASSYLVGSIAPWPSIFLVWVAMMPLIQPGTRVDVACRYVLLMPLLPAISPMLQLGGHNLGQFGVADALGFGSLCAMAVATDRPAARRLAGFAPEDAALLLLVLIFGIAGPRFADISALFHQLIFCVVTMVIPFWIIRGTVRSREELQLVLGCFACAGIILSVMALYEHHKGWALFDPIGYRYQTGFYLARTASVRGGALRSSVTMNTPIELGTFLMLSLLAIYSARALFRSKEIWLGSAGLLGLGLLATQSRGALVAAAFGAFVVLVAQRRWLWSAGVALGSAFGYGMLALVARSSMRVAAFMGAGKQFGNYKDYRTLLLERGMQEGRHHPIVGTSIDNVYASLADIEQGEHIIDLVNTYLHIFLISGAVGLVLVLIVLVWVYRDLIQPVRDALTTPVELTRGFCLAGLSAMLVSLFTSSFSARMPFMLVLVLAMGRVIRFTEPRYARKPELPVLWEIAAEQRAPAPPALRPAAA